MDTYTEVVVLKVHIATLRWFPGRSRVVDVVVVVVSSGGRGGGGARACGGLS